MCLHPCGDLEEGPRQTLDAPPFGLRPPEREASCLWFMAWPEAFCYYSPKGVRQGSDSDQK